MSRNTMSFALPESLRDYIDLEWGTVFAVVAA